MKGEHSSFTQQGSRLGNCEIGSNVCEASKRPPHLPKRAEAESGRRCEIMLEGLEKRLWKLSFQSGGNLSYLIGVHFLMVPLTVLGSSQEGQRIWG